MPAPQEGGLHGHEQHVLSVHGDGGAAHGIGVRLHLHLSVLLSGTGKPGEEGSLE